MLEERLPREVGSSTDPKSFDCRSDSVLLSLLQDMETELGRITGLVFE
jgi:hypothetical protein